jgi:hypothetical protein
MESNVFHYVFDFDEWPSSHTNKQNISRPYHGSLLKLRLEYKNIFPEKEFQEIDIS